MEEPLNPQQTVDNLLYLANTAEYCGMHGAEVDSLNRLISSV